MREQASDWNSLSEKRRILGRTGGGEAPSKTRVRREGGRRVIWRAARRVRGIEPGDEMEAIGVASQWQQLQAGAGAGAPSMIRSVESSEVRGKALLPHSKLAALLQRRRTRRSTKDAGGLLVLAMAGKKKVNAYDAGWSKQWFGAGLFAENFEKEEVNFLKKLEKKKLFSQVEKSGLLSKAESAGLSLSTIEKLGLLSKAEDLGLLTLAENFANSSPATLASFSIPLFVASILTLVVIPDTSTPIIVVQNVLAALFMAGSVGLFVGSIILSGLQEE